MYVYIGRKYRRSGVFLCQMTHNVGKFCRCGDPQIYGFRKCHFLTRTVHSEYFIETN